MSKKEIETAKPTTRRYESATQVFEVRDFETKEGQEPSLRDQRLVLYIGTKDKAGKVESFTKCAYGPGTTAFALLEMMADA